MKEHLQYIESVKELENGGWLVNGTMSVPNDNGNRHCQDVLEYIDDGGEVIPYIPPTEQELLEQWRETTDCSRLQAMLALEEQGLLDQMETWINGDAPKVAKLAWKEAYRFSRKSSLFNEFKGLFNLTDEDINDLFKLALTKEV